MSRRKKKWIILLLSIIVYVFISSFIKPVSLSSRSMVIGFTIDMGEEKNFLVGTEILVANTTIQNTGYASMMVEAEGDTVVKAFDEISKRTGKSVVLTHCDTIIIGEDLIKNNKLLSTLAYFIGHTYLSDDAYVFSCKGKAKDILTYTSAVGLNPGSQLKQIVAHNDFDTIMTATLKSGLVNSENKGETLIVPLIELIETLAPQGTDEKTAPDEDKTQYIYEIKKSYITKTGNYVFTTSEDQNILIGYLNSKLRYGGFNMIGDNGEHINLHIINKRLKRKFNKDTNSIFIEIEFDTMIKEINNFDDLSVDIKRICLTPSEVVKLKKQVKDEILEFYKYTQTLDVDVYNFEQMFLSLYGKEVSIKDINLDVEIALRPM